MATKTEIANKALGLLGVSRAIANLETTQSATAFSLRTYYNEALSDALRGFWWPFASRYATLSLVEDLSQSSTADYPYVYAYPTACAEIRRIQIPGNRNPASDQKKPYIVGGSDSQKLIYTTINPAEVWYTKEITDTQFMPADFVLAFAAKLAFWCAPQIVGGTSEQIRKEVTALFDYQVKIAKSNALREMQSDQDTKSKLERSRR